MKNLTTYSVGICPLTEHILNTMSMNNIKLKKIKIKGFHNDQITKIIQRMQTYRTTLTLDTLIINNYCSFDARLSIPPFKLPTKLEYLTHLTIYGGDLDLLIEVQNLKALKTFTMKSLVIETFENLLLDDDDNLSIEHCGLKSLDLNVYCMYSDSFSMDQVNQIFDTIILPSCPLLENFKLSGLIYTLEQPNTFYLDFRQHPNMEIIDISLFGYKYYTFNHEQKENQVKKWRSFNDDLILEHNSTQQDLSSFHINLAWKTGNKMKLRLADCLRR